MRINRLFAVALVGLASSDLSVAGLFQSSARAQIVAGPLPHVPTPPNIIALEPVEQLGKDMLYDNTMSDPSGYEIGRAHV